MSTIQTQKGIGQHRSQFRFKQLARKVPGYVIIEMHVGVNLRLFVFSIFVAPKTEVHMMAVFTLQFCIRNKGLANKAHLLDSEIKISQTSVKRKTRN